DEPLGHQAIILGPALGGAVTAEIMIPARQGHHGLARRLVEAIRRGADAAGGQGEAPPQPGNYRLLDCPGRATPRGLGIRSLGFGRYLAQCPGWGSNPRPTD